MAIIDIATGETVRAWYTPHRDGKVHGIEWLRDSVALDRLERGSNIRPHAQSLESFIADVLADAAEAPHDSREDLTPAPAPGPYWGAAYMPEFEMKDN